MSETLRTFIAIELNPQIKQELAKIQSELKKSGADAKWVKPENIHLTLKFLGATAVDKIETINQALQDVAKNHSSFEMAIAQLGAFPRIESPRIIWLDINQGKEILKNLAREIEEKISVLGFPKENRPFQTHITLARIKSSLNRIDLAKKLKETTPLPLSQRIDKITFLKSTLTPQGPNYEIIKEIDLKTI
ncbi:MAG: RNA 2',3'-cyclic phosphodiesterase [Candidatus Omnitrophota bacterium]|nr:RNA 2',3'-cyclic phosphodiesterase [Candidatus Omnitrophota bacterium]